MSTTKGIDTLPQISKEIIAHDFMKALKGKLDDEIIETVNKQINAVTTSYPATCRFINKQIYSEIQVAVTNGKTFKGNSSIASFLGDGIAKGQVNTNNIDLLYENTVSIMLSFLPIYMGISFFDKDSNFLGMFIGPAVASIAGTGGGKGAWY